MSERPRPFNGYRTAVTDPDCFFGRAPIVKKIRANSTGVHVLLGGRRIGKTSLLRYLEWSLLEVSRPGAQPLPVLINLESWQPQSLDQFRYLMISRLREAINRWREVEWRDVRKGYRRFLEIFPEAEISLPGFKGKLASAEKMSHEEFRRNLGETVAEMRADFNGVVFLFDEAEYVVSQTWADNAWSYLRGQKDTSDLSPYLGLVISGYRGVDEYQQKVGSALRDIAVVTWLDVLSPRDARSLMHARAAGESVALTEDETELLQEWSGNHPFLLQQMTSDLLDTRHCGRDFEIAKWRHRWLVDHHKRFLDWWNPEK